MNFLTNFFDKFFDKFFDEFFNEFFDEFFGELFDECFDEIFDEFFEFEKELRWSMYIWVICHWNKFEEKAQCESVAYLVEAFGLYASFVRRNQPQKITLEENNVGLCEKCLVSNSYPKKPNPAKN